MTVAVDKSNERVQRMFRQIAPRYDLMNHVLSLNIDTWWRRRTVALVPADGDAPLLDVCTGTGDLALAYHRRYPDLSIDAVDFCAEMLDIGRRKQRRIDTDRIRFAEADAQALPFGDNEFQIVCVAFGLRNVADTDQGIREMVRVARPGGRVAVLEFSEPGWRPFKDFYGFYFRHVLPRVGQWFARNEDDAYHYLPESVRQFPSGQALADRMTQCGLTEVVMHPMTLGVCTLYVGAKP